VRFSGYFAWLFWLFAHVYFLIGFRNRLVVLLDWAWLKIGLALSDDTPDSADRWRQPAKALQRWVLPEFELRVGMVLAALKVTQPA